MSSMQTIIDRMNRQALGIEDTEVYKMLWGDPQVRTTKVEVKPDLLASDFDDVPQRVMAGMTEPPAPPKPQVLDLTDQSYLRVVHDPERMVDIIKPHLDGVDFDTFVGTGLSGTLAAVAMAKAMNKNYLIARKPNDGTHSGNKAEGKLGKRWLFLDDLIATGATLGRAYDAVAITAERWDFKTEFVGAVLYGDGSWYPDKFISAKDCRYNLEEYSEYFPKP
ncbi:phosphoribosyl transferase [Mycobacterium phage SWU2]|uniref:Phosphoribosyltransferase domain-containing protein n=1 Tax=Mycobacterium phage SWU2 TaxID=2077150 RepID=A0A2K9VIA5_9CAUD|nr:phosphoribosyl transferase [Mycobacterium phage SWU2]AUV62022.1 hypothetical protein JX_gp63 [Mycobacterium phage SWU2]